MSLDNLGTKLYTLENENERLRAKIAGISDALRDVESDEFLFAKRSPSWMEGFTCAKVACTAAIQKYIDE